MVTFRKTLCFLVLMLMGRCAVAAHLTPARDLLELDLDTLMTIEIGPSADASAKGLSPPFAGGQIADGGRVGLLGTQSSLSSPFSVTSFTNEFIQNQQAASVGDVLQYDPAVRLARGFGNFQQAYMIRGLPLFSDDMAYNGLYGILPRQYLSAALIERVEVMHGANAFLNGAAPSSSGLGGAVNVMPKRAPKDSLTQFGIGYSSDSQYRLSGDVARRSEDHRWGARLNGVYLDGETEVDGENQQLDMLTLGMDYRGVKVRMSADVGFQDHQLDATIPSIDIAPGLPIPDAPDADNKIAQPWTYSNEKDVFATLRAEYDFTAQITGWIAAGMRQSEEDSRFTAFLTVFNPADDFTATRFDVTHEDSVTTGDAGLRIKFVTGTISHRLTLAANAYENEGRNAYALFDSITSNLRNPVTVMRPTSVVFAGGDLQHPLVTSRTQSSSVAIADEISLLNDKFLLTLGVRQQTIAEDNYEYVTGDILARYDENAGTPAAGLVYRMSAQWSAYCHYIEGLVKGDIAPETNASGIVANAGKSLAPYHVAQSEIGIKYQDSNLGTTLAMFELRKPMTGYNDNNALVEQNKQTHRGIEWTLYGEPDPGLRLFGGMSALQTDIANNDVIGTPHLQGNLNMEWEVPRWYGLTLTSQIMSTGSQYADADNSQKVPAWTRADIGVRYVMSIGSIDKFTVRASLQNVANKNYWASSGGYPGAGYLTLGEPRTLRVSTDFNF